MNILFHNITGYCIAITSLHVAAKDDVYSKKQYIIPIVFLLGIISHGILDIIPHCYPINSIFDAIFGLAMIIGLSILARPAFRTIIAGALIGSIVPDIIDHSAGIFKNHMGISINYSLKLFPWHWAKYSGSIYNGNCLKSAIYHSILIAVCIITLWITRGTIIKIYKR